MSRRTITVAGALLLLLLALVSSGCWLYKTTIEQRIDEFLKDLNTDSSRTRIYKNLHDDIDDAWKSGTLWENTPFAWENRPFGLSGMSYGKDSAQGTLTTGAPFSGPIYFDMKEDTDGWYIRRIDVNGTPVIF